MDRETGQLFEEEPSAPAGGSPSPDRASPPAQPRQTDIEQIIREACEREELERKEEEQGDGFAWAPECPDIIIQEQRAVAVYRNKWGHVVIRQENAGDYEEDAFIFLRDDEALKALIAALKREIGGR